ncbi:MAG: tetratricopeptide repeat protein [Clostridia bacterium]
MFRQKKFWMIIIAALLAAVCAVLITVYLNNKKADDYIREVEKADRYMQEMDYAKAEASYLEAIKIEPREEEPYLRLADIYIAQDQNDKAEDILEQGMEFAKKTGKIKRRQSMLKYEKLYYDYITDEIIPAVGLADIGNAGYDEDVNTGLISAQLLDVDRDGIPEMIVVYSEDRYCMDMSIAMYRIKDEKVSEVDERRADVQNAYIDENNEFSGQRETMYIKEYEGSYYIVNTGTGISSGGSSSSEHITVTELSKEGFDEKMSASSGVSHGSMYISIDDISVVRYDGIDQNRLEKAWNEGVKKLKGAIELFGLEEKVKLKKVEGWTSGPFWLSFEECDTDDDSETALCTRERVWTGEYQSNTEDFTFIRDKLK